MQQSVLTTQEVANRYCALAMQNKWPEILEELCSKDLVNTEPAHVMARGITPVTKGIAAIKAKGEANRALIATIHHQHCSTPLVAGNFFSVVLGRDITFKGKPRMSLEEIAVFEIRDGKIIAEQFFY